MLSGRSGSPSSITSRRRSSWLRFEVTGSSASWITSGVGGFGNSFAVDLDGLDAKDGELGEGNELTDDAGYGRQILAPAAGRVVYARNDVPDNPHPGTEPGDDFYKSLHDPIMASAGNCVVIDHGNSEFSVIMHMQPGSVTVKVGELVIAGQVIGKLGVQGTLSGHTCITSSSPAQALARRESSVQVSKYWRSASPGSILHCEVGGPLRIANEHVQFKKSSRGHLVAVNGSS